MMARKVRIEFPGAFYHVINRGNFRSWIFETGGARHSFRECLKMGFEAQGWRLHAWCLMGNHYHLLIETPKPNLVDGMKWVQSTFANRFNRFNKTNGHVFQGRYKAIILDKETVGPVCHYIHLNPVRAGLIAIEQLQDYRDSSFHQLWNSRQRWSFAEYATCLRNSGGFSDNPVGRRQYRDYLKRLSGDLSEQREMGFDSMSRGWAKGGEQFRQEILSNCSDQQLRRVVEAEASEMREPLWEHELVVALGLLGRTELDLSRARKGAPWKVALARHFRDRFLAPYRWLSARLSMGAVSSIQSLVSLHRRQKHIDRSWEILQKS